MPNPNPDPNAPLTFEIGLAMAGAISAGAYSAGVVDFMFHALDEWYALKGADPHDYPNHNVVVSVITGASAGAITGALAVAALRFDTSRQAPPAGQGQSYTLTPMYDAWVVNVDLRDQPGVTSVPGLLSTGDLKEGTPVTSLLNSQVLHQIGDVAFGYAGEGASLRKLPYISKHLHVYLMISNLRGVPYEVSFQGAINGGGYGMLNHADRAHFIVTELGTAPEVSSWDGLDPGPNLDVRNLPVGPEKTLVCTDPVWNACLTAALASSAFPLGFSPVSVAVDYTDFGHRQWPFPHDVKPPLDPDFPQGYAGDTDRKSDVFGFTCVDGGLCNNEPFEYAHYALLNPGDDHNAHAGAAAARAVIMIDPFPELPDFKSRDEQKTDLISMMVAMFSGLKDQSRFKASELAAALDNNWYSRFLIGPRRLETNPLLPGGPAPKDEYSDDGIACGLLGGFGGFLVRSFREHDYQLGRYNCYQFLKEWFVLPEANPIVASWSAAAAQNANCLPKNSTGARCVIPLVGACATSPTQLDWPRIGDSEINAILDAITNRADVLFPLFRQGMLGRFARFGAGLVWFAGVKSYVLSYMEWTIKSDLIRRDQYDGYELGSVAARRVMAILADPAHDYYTVAYLVDSTGVAPDVVQTILKMKSASNEDLASYDSSNQGWTFAKRAPSWWQNLRDQVAVGPPTLADVPQTVKDWQKAKYGQPPVPSPPPAPASTPTPASSTA